MFVGIEKFIEEKESVKGRKEEPLDIEENLTVFTKEEGFDENSCLEDLDFKLFMYYFFAFLKWRQKIESDVLTVYLVISSF